MKLKTEDRPNVIKAIAEAREHGDLSENAEYHAVVTVNLSLKAVWLNEDVTSRAEVIGTSFQMRPSPLVNLSSLLMKRQTRV